MFLFSLLCNKQQLNCTVPAVFILFVSYIHSVINLSMAKMENKSHLSTIWPTQLKAKKKKPANYSVTIENLHNLVHSDFRECSLFILFWRGGWLHHGGKKSLRCFLAVGGGHEGFFMSLDRNLNAYFIGKFDWNTIKQPFYIKQNYEVSNPRYQIFWRTRTMFFFFELICNCLNCNYHCNYHIFS